MTGFEKALNDAVMSGGGFSSDGHGNTAITDRNGKVIARYDASGNKSTGTSTPKSTPVSNQNNNRRDNNNFTYNQGTIGSNWNGNVNSAPSITNFGVSYKDPVQVVDLNQANNAFQASGLNPNQQASWMQSYIGDHRQDGGASTFNYGNASTTGPIADNWSFFNQDKQVVNPGTSDFSMYNNLKPGEAEMSTNSGTGQAYYVTRDANGNIYKGAVPNAISMNYFSGNNGMGTIQNTGSNQSYTSPSWQNDHSSNVPQVTPQVDPTSMGMSSDSFNQFTQMLQQMQQQQQQYQQQISQLQQQQQQAQQQQQQQADAQKNQQAYVQSQQKANQYGNGVYLFSNAPQTTTGVTSGATSANGSTSNSGTSNSNSGYLDAISRNLSGQLWNGTLH